jgi:hypothetical protein
LLEFLNIPYEIDREKINKIMWQKKEGAQMFLHNPKPNEAIQEGEIEPGVYKMQNSKLRFVREGYELKHLKDKDEFLLTDGIQKKGAKIQPFQRLCRVLAKDRVLNENLNDLTPEVKKFIKLVYEKLKVEPKKI